MVEDTSDGHRSSRKAPGFVLRLEPLFNIALPTWRWKQTSWFSAPLNRIHNAERPAARIRIRRCADRRSSRSRGSGVEVSLAKAAELAGISWAQMKDILLEKGVVPRLGPDDIDDARAEAEVLRAGYRTLP